MSNNSPPMADIRLADHFARASLKEKQFFIIGIDFGTTYSGVAWCWSGEPEIIHNATRWPTTRYLVADNAKAPSEIYYPPGSDEPQWGYDVPLDCEPIRWFKLLLVPEADLKDDLKKSKHIQRARELVQESGKTPVEIIAAYLSLLWKHTMDDINRQMEEVVVKGLQFKVWLTIPAIWDENLRNQMLMAATLAGILDKRAAGETKLDMVAEPEAAALAVLDDFKIKNRSDIKSGDVYVVCDAGGGTVDIISYMVENTNPVIVSEFVEGDGKMCGAIFIDEAFEKLLRAILDDRWRRMTATSKKTMLNTEWEYGIKRQFDDSDRTWNVQVPTSAFPPPKLFKRHPYDDKKGDVPIKDGQVEFERGHIRSFFGTVLPQIRKLILDQVKAVKEKQGKPPRAIMLVGGLGGCKYLYQQIKKEFEPKGIKVLQPDGYRPWNAICRGAVIRGISDSAIRSKHQSVVKSRIARMSYGLVYTTDFSAGIHDEADRFWSEKEGRHLADNQMHWYMKKGSNLLHKDPISFTYYGLIDEDDIDITLQLYRNAEEKAPSRVTPQVKQLQTINLTIDRPLEEFPFFVNAKGVKTTSRRVDMTVEMTPTGVMMLWKVYVRGRVMAEENVKIDPQ